MHYWSAAGTRGLNSTMLVGHPTHIGHHPVDKKPSQLCAGYVVWSKIKIIGKHLYPVKQRSYQRSDLQSTQCFIYSPSRNKYFLYSKTKQFLYGPDIRWHMGTWLSHNWPKNSLVTRALWMNCAAAVIMQLLSPQDWLDGIQAALLVITISPMFSHYLSRALSKTYALRNVVKIQWRCRRVTV